MGCLSGLRGYTRSRDPIKLRVRGHTLRSYYRVHRPRSVCRTSHLKQLHCRSQHGADLGTLPCNCGVQDRPPATARVQ